MSELTDFRVSAEQFDAVQLPGGTINADTMCMVPEVQDFLRAMQDAGKPFAAICHRNAGGNWVDHAMIEDGNWVTSLSDLPAFIRGMIALFPRSAAAAHR